MAEQRLIDANAAKEMIVNHADEFSDVLNRREKALLIGGGTSCIDKCPTVDAVEVVHGRWIVKGQEVFCSHCDKESGYNHWGASAFSDYCPNCGSKMDGERRTK
jgi:hypothetical protein